ncbi:hypothetical protein [Dehalobacterium formicoaceticum]|uniref:Uncharacterized protein n=1 Tax=Dehalobacterium formicoaceticum TaxID=51515 RepID=A0ABT1Y5M5_9FIRM|nr:hypothetical protein [Dehalobacterium formicoaceticum]MCR6545858.1 hypothetical protein [Dehalobacterium formicoaceticum]
MTKRKINWDQNLWQLLTRSEKILVRMIIISLVLLVAAQSLLTSDPLRFYLSWSERLEGQPFQEWSQPSARVLDTESPLFAHLTIELQDFSSLAKAKLFINGKEVADFRNKKITVKVSSNDVVSVDGSFYHRPLTFRITESSSNIAAPVLYQQIETNRSLESFPQVQFK